MKTKRTELTEAVPRREIDVFDEMDRMFDTLFHRGWLRPFPSLEFLAFLDVIPPVLWFAGKVLAFIFLYIWFRGTFPRYRFDQLMAVGWKWLLPLSLANVALVALGVLLLKG